MRVVRHGVLVVALVASLAPLVFMVLTSLKTSSEYASNPTGLPHGISFANYRRALADLPTLRWMLNSLVVTTVAVAASTAIAALGAYAISFGRFHGRRILLGVNIGLIMVPPVVLLLPVFVTMVNLRLINTLPSVAIFYTCLLVPFAVFFLTSFFRTVPPDVMQAAAIDGAGPGRTLWSVLLPLTRPALLTVCVVNAIWVWNELLISLVFLQAEDQRTLMGGLTLFQGRYATDQPLVLAVATLSIIPVAAFYALSQRSFVRGLTAGIGK
jgi:raffinose/stachyose/melibiose transport system permease protein